VKVALPKDRVSSYLVLPDVHVKEKKGQIAGLDYASNLAVFEYAKAHTWDGVILLGDVLDFNVISSHNKTNLKAVEGERLSADYAAGDHYLAHLNLATAGVPAYWLEGNHEYRITRLIAAQPQLEGIIEVPKMLDLKRCGINWIPYWSTDETLKIGKAEFGHGRYHARNHPTQHLERYDCNFFYGHLHSVEQAAKVVRGPDSTKIAHCLGCLCDYDAPYLNGAPTKWQQAFARFDFFPDGTFTYQVYMLFKNRFFAAGHEYNGRLIEKDAKKRNTLLPREIK
jgi:hypothetical protein